MRRTTRTIGIGAGQMSRVVSAKIAGHQGRRSGPVGAGLGDGLAMRSSRSATASTPRAEAGIKAVIQPGGSMRDNEVIAAADEHGLAMVFTGRAAFPALISLSIAAVAWVERSETPARR